ncbi:MAG TPA: 2-phospho-L-lactate guanylyltransferase [Methylomirabilota bacterium]|nr:2-phospho-L-lactate guanylyltransferase [Methylomirabilota bacterium]
MTTPLVAAVPLKDLVNAKQRLVPALSAAERRALARAMLEDVLDAMVMALPGAVVVVTTDEEVRALADARHVTCWIEPANRGHTAAVAFAQREAAARGARRFLTIPGDVPCVTPDEVTTLCRALDGPGVTFVPSRSGAGTNAALLEPPGAMALTFGEPSFDNHLAAARAAGLHPRVLHLPGIGLDVDAPEDLPVLLERGGATRSGRLLRGFPAAARFAAAT